MMLKQFDITTKLREHAQLFSTLNMRDLFNQDSQRFQRLSIEYNNLLFDYSKNLVTPDIIQLLITLAEKCQLGDHIDRLFSGAPVNTTENRPALHTALRSFNNQPLYVGEQNITLKINNTLDQMAEIVFKIHTGQWLGFSNKPFTDVVNIGIGGSDLGPAMATYALTPYHLNKVRCHFVSNIDGADIWETIKNLNPETTLFIIESKSFTTQETLRNAVSAKSWLLKVTQNEAKLDNHFIAVTARENKAREWGIKTILPIWDWVGGRFSLWSAIGLPIALAIGMDNFKELLKGANALDQHFKSSLFEKNIPVILALLNIWYVNFFNVKSYAILPYDQHLELLPAYLQQLEMESNGKSQCHQGNFLDYATSPVIWGMVGSNGQHAFHQLLHQGTQLIPIDFILSLNSHHPLDNHHTWLVANCLSQSEALMLGKTAEEVRKEMENEKISPLEIEKILKHKVLPGNRPSNTLMLPKLTPYMLGMLIALYEHKTFVQSVIWDVNCFDQWGVEFGKQLSQPIFKQLTSSNLAHSHTSSTQGLINYYKKFQNR